MSQSREIDIVVLYVYVESLSLPIMANSDYKTNCD